MAAVVDDKILCMYGGLSPDLNNLDQIKNLPHPTAIPDTDLLCDLLWSDPSNDVKGWGLNDRRVSFTFGPDKMSEFLAKHDLDLVCRAHQVVEDGYEFFAERQLVTIFSAPNYCGEFDNAGAMMSIDGNLMCSFQLIGGGSGYDYKSVRRWTTQRKLGYSLIEREKDDYKRNSDFTKLGREFVIELFYMFELRPKTSLT
ncbi:hypothetical protein AgCh_001255 [Apium graveolens]